MHEHVSHHLVPQKPNNLPPFRNRFDNLLILRSALKRFHQRNLGQRHDLRFLDDFPDSERGQDKRDITMVESA